ncbi:hypothetical protein BGX26_006523, partial [Mortierella sp. AD094]
MDTESAPQSKLGQTPLRKVLNAISENGFTMRTFLEAFFTSKDTSTRHQANTFYGRGGHTHIFQIWLSNIEDDRHMEALCLAASGPVVDKMKKELAKLSEAEDLRLPSSNVSRQKLSSFSLDFISNRMAALAPMLTSTLRSLATLNPKSSRSDSSIVPTVASMLLFVKNRASNYIQMMMGMYLYSRGVSRRVIEVLSKAGLSVSYTTIWRAVQSLTEDALKIVRAVVVEKPWILVYDNINIARRKYDQRLQSMDEFDSGTTASVIIGDYFSGDFASDTYHRLCADDFLPSDANSQHFKKVCRFHLINAIKKNLDCYKGCKNEVPEINPLPVDTTTTYPLPAQKIDESTLEGNLAILESVREALGLPQSWFDEVKVIVAGDQLTIARLRSLIELRKHDVDSYHKLEWVVPMIQLFHVQMLLGGTILRTHYGSMKTPGSLAYSSSLLGRKRIQPEKPDFHASDDHIRENFDAMALRAFEEVLGTEDLGQFALLSDPDLINLRISSSVNAIIDKYINNSDRLEELGTRSRNGALFLRDAIIYLELSAAISAGDLGRLEEIFVWITLMFQAGATKNYANEVIHLHCGLRYAWSADTKKAILSSWLINLSGTKNTWIPTDLYQEYNNLLTKIIYAAKGPNFSWEHLSSSISMNIRVFSEISKHMESQYETTENNTKHVSVSSAKSVAAILESLRDHGVLSAGTSPDTQDSGSEA